MTFNLQKRMAIYKRRADFAVNCAAAFIVWLGGLSPYFENTILKPIFSIKYV
ncbi:hypothetical protein PFLA_a2079 [Pseudoalteromonas flavipulchra NCIMB 2033 = ATCC BAA-314]|nr:hypothetical protein [Pseudoalteromonas flavipulchra NCIMB 2033 = ATCC BAA-314]